MMYNLIRICYMHVQLYSKLVGYIYDMLPCSSVLTSIVRFIMDNLYVFLQFCSLFSVLFNSYYYNYDTIPILLHTYLLLENLFHLDIYLLEIKCT